MTLLHRAWSP